MGISSYKTIYHCRVCGSAEFEDVINLGDLAVSSFVREGERGIKAPLNLVKCKQCGLHQLKDTVDLDKMYRQYWYKSSLNSSMLRDLANVVKSVEEIIDLKEGDIVVDIGCNDGSMFDFYTTSGLYKCGFDPALNLQEEAKKHCTWFVNDYFSAEKFPYATAKAKVVTAIAMFYDLEDPMRFLRDVVSILDQDGVFVVQLTDLYAMYKTNAFDNICHEHLEYYSLKVLLKMFNDAGLKIFKVVRNKVNGGSLRVYAQHTNGPYEVDPSLYTEWGVEEYYFRSPEGSPQAFRERVENIKKAIMWFLEDTRIYGETVYVMGASTKGNTLLQYFGIDDKLIQYAAEVNSDKYGLYTVETSIEIIPEEEALLEHPDYFLILPWHFIENLVEKHYDYLESGGRFIIPCPAPLLVSIEGVEEIDPIL